MKKFWKEYFLFQKEPSPGWSRGQRELYYAYRVALLLCAGLCMGLALLVQRVVVPGGHGLGLPEDEHILKVEGVVPELELIEVAVKLRRN